MRKIGFLLMLIMIGGNVFGQKSKKVAYKAAQNYFVKNTVSEGVMVFPKITTEKEFEKFFGMAPLMGKGGQPTPIDFSKQYVIAVIDDLSYNPKGLDPVSLLKNGSEITFTFKRESGGEGSAQFRRCLILIIDKKHEGNVIIKDQNGTEFIPYTVANRYFVKNTVENKTMVLSDITSEEQFENYFGMATVMGEDGQPTPIDFSKQFVIAFINESSEDAVNYTFNSLIRKNNETTLVYRKEGGTPGDSYRYCAILIVDKKYAENIKIQLN